MATATVYCFYTYRYPGDERFHWPRAATLKTIESLDGVPLKDTALEIDPDKLDAGGFLNGPANCAHVSHRHSLRP